jgi:hypothetical protein
VRVILRFEIPDQAGDLRMVASKILRTVSLAIRDVVGYSHLKMEVEDSTGKIQKFAFDRRGTGERRKDRSYRSKAAA